MHKINDQSALLPGIISKCKFEGIDLASVPLTHKVEVTRETRVYKAVANIQLDASKVFEVDVTKIIPRHIKEEVYNNEIGRTLVLQFNAPKTFFEFKIIYDDSSQITMPPVTDTEEVVVSKYPKIPVDLQLPEILWKVLISGAKRSKNILMTGVSGAGKTSSARAVAEALERPYFYFNMGSTQDPRSTLIGNTHFGKDEGTYLHQSTFIRAIQTKGAVILLDELSRAHPEAWNILMTVLDEGQRYVRLDEANTIDNTINVAEGVTFIGTANIGREYTSTRQMDKALLDRFLIVEMPTHTKESITKLLVQRFPDLNIRIIEALASIYIQVRSNLDSDKPTVSNQVSIRALINTAEYILDEFKFSEAVEHCIYPFFPVDGGANSERTFIKQIVQQFGLDNMQPKRNIAGGIGTQGPSTSQVMSAFGQKTAPVNSNGLPSQQSNPTLSPNWAQQLQQQVNQVNGGTSNQKQATSTWADGVNKNISPMLFDMSDVAD